MNEAITFLRQLLLTREGLLITPEAYNAAVLQVFPLGVVQQSGVTPPSYNENSANAFATLMKDVPADISLTREFDSKELPNATVAYHRINGFITASSHYYFSSKRFEQELLAAESNPAISCHFFHINSGGGEAWYLDRLSETIQQLKKPIITLFEQIGGSAAYYIGCQAQRVYAMTSNDILGCIGSMVDFYDFDGYFEKLGIKRIKARATQSDLKNKDVEDLINGKPQNYVTRFLDPLNEQFLACVRANRPKLAKVKDDEPALRGENFITESAIEVGLIDGKRTFSEALVEAKQMAEDYDSKRQALNIYNS